MSQRGAFWKRGAFHTGKAAGKVLWKEVWKGEFGGSGKVLKKAGISRPFPISIWKGDLGVAVLLWARTLQVALQVLRFCTTAS